MATLTRWRVVSVQAVMGLGNASSVLSFYRAIVPQNALELTEEAGFDPKKLRAILDDPFAEGDIFSTIIIIYQPLLRFYLRCTKNPEF